MVRFILLFLLTFTSFAHARYAFESYIVRDRTGDLLRTVSQYRELTIDHVRKGQSFEIYGPPGLGKWLRRIGAEFLPLQESVSPLRGDYPTPEQIEEQLKTLVQSAPQTARLFSIGKSVQGRNLWVVKISRQVNVDDGRPEFKYVANMHGDEIVGRELMVRLIADLIKNDGTDPFITKLLDTTQIYIMPSMNPDGAAAAQRANAKWIDLNRDFPDFTTDDNQNNPAGRAPETQAMMVWQNSRHFRLSANFHGGAEVVNYPWDTTGEKHPEFDLIHGLSLEYASLVPYISSSSSFPKGITNGYDWYEVNGGMQDWSYNWYRDLQITIELSNQKWPSYSTVDQYYAQNRTALIKYISRVHNVPPQVATPIRR